MAVVAGVVVVVVVVVGAVVVVVGVTVVVAGVVGTFTTGFSGSVSVGVTVVVVAGVVVTVGVAVVVALGTVVAVLVAVGVAVAVGVEVADGVLVTVDVDGAVVVEGAAVVVVTADGTLTAVDVCVAGCVATLVSAVGVPTTSATVITCPSAVVKIGVFKLMLAFCCEVGRPSICPTVMGLPFSSTVTTTLAFTVCGAVVRVNGTMFAVPVSRIV